MVSEVFFKLTSSFPEAFLYRNGEMIVHRAANEYFNFANCKDELEVKCKILEWLSRGASYTQPFKGAKKNKEFNNYMLNGINSYLGTGFSIDDMKLIYEKLGNQVHRKLTVKFIESNYNLSVFD